jgi:hypothetical protein
MKRNVDKDDKRQPLDDRTLVVIDPILFPRDLIPIKMVTSVLKVAHNRP